MPMSRILVITPTYNERENLPELAKQIFDLAIPGLELLVVDDNSPDGTGEVADELKALYPAHVIHRSKKEGLGPAYIEGMRWAIQNGYELIVQMDCDLSHDPKDIPRFIRASENADVVLGSRYVEGGGTENWSYLRKLISRFGSLYARFILRMPYRDLTGGYKCFHVDILKRLLERNTSSVGYNFQIEMTYYAHRYGAKIVEIPIIFRERTIGKSKFNIGIMIESFLQVIRLRIYG